MNLLVKASLVAPGPVRAGDPLPCIVQATNPKTGTVRYRINLESLRFGTVQYGTEVYGMGWHISAAHIMVRYCT